MPKIHISRNRRKKYVLRDTSCFNMYNCRVLLSRHAVQHSVQMTRVGMPRDYSMKTATLKASAVSAQEMLAVRTLVGHLGESNKVIISTSENKANPTSGLRKRPTGLQLMRYYHDK